MKRIILLWAPVLFGFMACTHFEEPLPETNEQSPETRVSWTLVSETDFCLRSGDKTACINVGKASLEFLATILSSAFLLIYHTFLPFPLLFYYFLFFRCFAVLGCLLRLLLTVH